MTIRLLDVNALIALMWPAHESHAVVHEWFAKTASRGWATCPITQAGFVRIISNPAFSSDAVTPSEASDLLSTNTQMKGHHFWSDEISYSDAVESFKERIVGHRQITDAYLLGLAIKKKGRLATLDRGILSVLDDNTDRVEIIGR